MALLKRMRVSNSILIKIPVYGVGILLEHGKCLEAGGRRRRIRSVSEGGRDGIWLSKCTEVSPSIFTNGNKCCSDSRRACHLGILLGQPLIYDLRLGPCMNE